ncbi:MAG: mechanosensitive ion channel [Deltaproteobacteria bacterium]|nr:mechanosensitive ion channel [Deltaproteobacteria bacterium]
MNAAAATPSIGHHPATAPAVTPDVAGALDQVAALAGAPVSAPPSDNLLAFIDPGGVPTALALILGAVVLVRLLNRVLRGVAERIVQRRLVIKQVTTLAAFIIYALAILLAAVRLFNFSSSAMFALSGTIAVAVAFALKDVAASFMASITILLNKPFQVGDRIQFGSYYGEVTEIGLRTVRLVTLDDSLVTIPSNKFLTEAVASANAGALDCMVVVPFYLAPDADIGRAKEIVQDALLASRYLYLGKPFTVLVGCEAGEMSRAMVKLVAKAYVYDARHEKAFASDVTEHALREFGRARIRLAGAGEPVAADG